MALTARGTFDVTMHPAPAELDGAIARFELVKTFHGDLQATGHGVMLSAGDPQTGSAGYVAMETVVGRLGDRDGGFALQQFGSMSDGAQRLQYEIVPGSGSGQLRGLTGTLDLTITDDASHHYHLQYTL